jgi:hypothetical protein
MPIDEQLENLDLRLFDKIPSQSTEAANLLHRR